MDWGSRDCKREDGLPNPGPFRGGSSILRKASILQVCPRPEHYAPVPANLREAIRSAEVRLYTVPQTGDLYMSRWRAGEVMLIIVEESIPPRDRFVFFIFRPRSEAIISAVVRRGTEYIPVNPDKSMALQNI